MKQCPYCQAELADDAAMCQHCGRGRYAAVRAAASAPAAPAPPPIAKRSAALTYLGAFIAKAFGLALVGGLVWLMFQVFPAKPGPPLTQTDWIVLGVGLYLAWSLGKLHDRIEKLEERLMPDRRASGLFDDIGVQ